MSELLILSHTCANWSGLQGSQADSGSSSSAESLESKGVKGDDERAEVATGFALLKAGRKRALLGSSRHSMVSHKMTYQQYVIMFYNTVFGELFVPYCARYVPYCIVSVPHYQLIIVPYCATWYITPHLQWRVEKRVSRSCTAG